MKTKLLILTLLSSFLLLLSLNAQNRPQREGRPPHIQPSSEETSERLLERAVANVEGMDTTQLKDMLHRRYIRMPQETRVVLIEVLKELNQMSEEEQSQFLFEVQEFQQVPGRPDGRPFPPRNGQGAPDIRPIPNLEPIAPPPVSP